MPNNSEPDRLCGFGSSMATSAKSSVRPRIIFAILAAVLCFSSSAIRSESSAVVVIYPDLNDYNAIFESIAAGIEKKTTGPVHRIPLPEGYSPADLKESLAGRPVKGVVALGRRGIEAVQRSDWKGPTAVSAIIWDSSLSAPPLPGISLDPDPRKVLGHLKVLAPKIRRVHAVINQEQSGWLVERSRAAASELGFTLVVKAVATKRAAALAYGDVLNDIDAEHDALWLPLDPTFDEATLRLVLGAAWKRRLVVFSSAPEHAQRGALFSFYPDYQAIGQRLAGLLQEQPTADPRNRLIRPTTDIKLAVNLRTARHLGFEYSRYVEAKFDVVFR